MELPDVICLGKEKYSGLWLRKRSEEEAVKQLAHLDKNQVINAWKIANGKKKQNKAK